VLKPLDSKIENLRNASLLTSDIVLSLPYIPEGFHKCKVQKKSANFSPEKKSKF